MPPMPNIQETLAQAQHQLASALSLPASEARIEAQLLLRRALGNISHAQLLMVDRESMPQVQAEGFGEMLQRRLAGEPVAYILGQREFYGLILSVSPDVLIPRADTETLVEAALARIPEQQSFHTLDLGTGSGAIALAIASQRSLSKVTAVDASLLALQVAKHNAEALRLANVQLLLSDWFAAVAGEIFDVIVSNPPYIAANDPHLAQGDLRFEPAMALASGADGLDDIRRIVSAAPHFLKPGGWLMLEHGYDQAPAVRQLLEENGLIEVGSEKDLAGIERVTLGRTPS